MEQARDAMDLYDEITTSASKIRAVADLIGLADNDGMREDTLSYASMVIEEQAERIMGDVADLFHAVRPSLADDSNEAVA